MRPSLVSCKSCLRLMPSHSAASSDVKGRAYRGWQVLRAVRTCRFLRATKNHLPADPQVGDQVASRASLRRGGLSPGGRFIRLGAAGLSPARALCPVRPSYFALPRFRRFTRLSARALRPGGFPPLCPPNCITASHKKQRFRSSDHPYGFNPYGSKALSWDFIKRHDG